MRIFEGDICKDSMGWVFEVRWDNENARFLGRHDKPRGDTYICYVGRIPAVEIIGSIHDTPELTSQAETPHADPIEVGTTETDTVQGIEPIE